ncbi:MAG TPA: hypothetical protein VGO50_12675 [Pyrinomonadaceae bacterium]|jgi:hypothetical protein|nr:hypothetical protein [Pyrinomonadaceae bacterium]
MKKMIKTFLLVLALTFVVLATTGDIPIPGVQGCAPGLWYPESHICCMPTEFCPAEGPVG